MADNIKGNAPNAVVAKTTVSFATAGITALNTEIVYLVDDPLKSYVPGRAINGISGFEAGKGYYLVAKTAMDLSTILVPPVDGVIQLAVPGSFTANAASSSQINLSWATVPNATAYVVDRATNVGFTTGVTLGIYNGAGTSYNDTGLTASTAYYYRIRATAAGYVDSAYGTATATTQAAGGSYDADAQTFFTNAGITNTAQKDAVDDLVVALKAAGIWAKAKAIYPFVGGTASQHKYNLKNPLDTDGAFRLSFTGGILHNSNGITFDGAGGSADTHFTPNPDFGSNGGTMSLYLRNTPSGNYGPIFTQQSGGLSALIGTNAANFGGSNVPVMSLNSEAGRIVPSSSPGVTGLLSISNTGGTGPEESYRNGASLGNGATVGLGLSAYSVRLGGYYAGSGGGDVAFNTSFFGFFEFLNDTENADLYTAVQALQTALSRQV